MDIEHAKAQIKKLGATQVAFMHNHPLGDPTHSYSDLQVAQHYMDALGDTYAYDIITNGETFSHTQRTDSGKLEYVDNVALDQEQGLRHPEDVGRSMTDALREDPLFNSEQSLAMRGTFHTLPGDTYANLGEIIEGEGVFKLARLGKHFNTAKNFTTFVMADADDMLRGIVEFENVQDWDAERP